jgi:hypothetical protein
MTMTTELRTLERQWRAHENDGCAATNTILAVYGVASPLGRFADNFSLNNPPYADWLNEIAYDAGLPPNERDCRMSSDERPQSAAAVAIRTHGLRAISRRHIPMTASAHAALLDYYRERLDLLAKTEPVIVAHRQRERVRVLQRHVAAIRRAVALPEAGPAEGAHSSKS